MSTGTKSPEETGVYLCPACGNTERFIGHDSRGYPGADCECGAYENGDRECTCNVTLKQPFTVVDPQPCFPASLIYECHSGGYDAEIGSYTRIDCRDCGAIIWEEPVTR